MMAVTASAKTACEVSLHAAEVVKEKKGPSTGRKNSSSM